MAIDMGLVVGVGIILALIIALFLVNNYWPEEQPEPTLDYLEQLGIQNNKNGDSE